MAVFKCKMCGGDLEITDGVTITECEFCGTKQTVPTVTDENIQNLFNRANTLRIKSEFDKAEKLYEKIIQVDSTQSEAYWGLILCKYGIEYVDDPATLTKIPTCHRASYDSIIADEDYKTALKNADSCQRSIYEEQAKAIDRIQKDILSLAQKEETYDVFICYKETDAEGKRTQDSVIANDIYHQLTQEGFKVFYASITLEGKLGSAYEPIIFAALSSAKVMLTIGTKPEYFNAVWVKNEWSRFLKIIKNDHSKLLIPCYKEMDAYELPEEFAHLQAQDMSKIGFINDIVRGIKKVIVKDEPKQTTVGGNTNVAPLLKRAFMFVEDSKWAEANEYCEKVLDIDPECADAYLVKLLVELRVNRKSDLASYSKPFSHMDDFKKIERFGDEALINELKQYDADIRERNEEARKLNIYNTAVKLAAIQSSAKQIEAAKEFEKITGYRDSSEKAKECYQNFLQLSFNLASELMDKATTSNQYAEAGKKFLKISNGYQPAKEKAEECQRKSQELAEVERKDSIYSEALDTMKKNDVTSLETAIQKFKSIIDWKDSESKVSECNQKISELKKQQEQKKKKARKKKILCISIPVSVVVLALLVIFVVIPFSNLWSGNYAEYIKFYKIEHFDIPEGVTEIEAGQFSDCYSLESVTIPDSVTSISDSAFYECWWLTSIAIGNGVTSIGDYAFYGCDGLTSVTIGNGVIEIGDYAFYGCDGLTSVTIGNGVTEIGDHAFSYCTGLTSIVIPDSVTSIGDSAFDYCTGLTSITIGNSVTSIGDFAFYECDGLTSVTIGNSVTIIGDFAFYKCGGLTSVTIGNGVTEIGEYAFYGCEGLTSIKYRGTEEQWESIDKVSGWNSHTGSYTITYNYTGE